MSTPHQEITTAVDRASEGAMSKMDENRQERWDAEKEDRASLRESLETSVAAIHDAPKKRLDPELESLDGPGAIRRLAERMYDESHVNSVKREREQAELGDFQRLSAKARRTHGRSGTEALEQLLAAEQALRDDPAGALQWLAQSYGDGRVAQRVSQHQATETLKSVHEFFAAHEISPAIETAMAEHISSGKFRPSGDPEADLVRAYREVLKGSHRARA